MRKRLLALILVCLASVLAIQAQRNRTFNDKEARDITAQLRVKLDDFKINLQDELKSKRVSRIQEENILRAFDELVYEVDDYQDKLLRKRDSQYDVSIIIGRGKSFERELNRINPSFRLQRDWNSIKDSIESLGRLYNVSWNNQGGGISLQGGLTGTYSLDEARSEDVKQVVKDVVYQSNVSYKEAAERDLEALLAPPQRLAIEVKGKNVKLASSFAPQLEVIADGQSRLQTLSDGRVISIRASFVGNALELYSASDDSDYKVTFSPVDNGRQIKVTRSVKVDYLDREVSTESYYFKTDSVARFNIYDSNASTIIAGSSENRKFIVPNGIILTGTLENDISTKTSRNYDRFSMTIVSPTEFRGAVVEGYLTNVSRSGRVSGRSQINLNFETIRMPNGETYAFKGIVMSVTDTEGKTIKVDPEGTTKGDSQTKETVKRGGIGAALGAVIGAIVGGAKGAAIGAIIGASAGAGSVVVQGKDDLELKTGSTIMVQSSTPNKR